MTEQNPQPSDEQKGADSQAEIEARKQKAAAQFGGWAIVAAIWSVNISNIASWASPIFYIFALSFFSLLIVDAYERIVLGIKISTARLIVFAVLSIMLLTVTLLDSSMRQGYRYYDCLRLEEEIVTAAPGNRNDAATAFQALRCQPTGGLVERWKGPTLDQERAVRKANEAAARKKAAEAK